MSRPIRTRFLRPIILTALLLAAGWITAGTPLPGVQASVAPRPARQGQVVGTGPNRAALAIGLGDEQVATQCVAFSEEEIGGDELLSRSDLAPVFSTEGAVCAIGGQGCPSDDCFCQCTDLNDCTYWAYYQRKENQWIYSQFGVMADTVAVRNGDMQAWSWGKGTANQGADPPDVTFDEICTEPTTATPTLTPTTVTNTPQPSSGPTAPPQATFYATLQSVAPTQCTMLNWQTIDATSVTLDGGEVALSGSQEVCPNADQRWTLVASNNIGQVTGQVFVRVMAAATSQPTSTPSASPSPAVSTPNRPAGGGARAALPTPTQRPIITQAPRPLATTAQQAFVPTPGIASSALPPGNVAGGGVPFAPTAEPLPVLTSTPQPTPTRYIFSPIATETQRPRRTLGKDGGPTPTPILLARSASGGSGQAPRARTGNNLTTGTGTQRQLVQSRAFTPALLPQYAAYVGTMAVLLAMGWSVLRRRQGREPITARQSHNPDEPMTGPGRKE